ncbi:MAG: PaaI family thioesterase [Clostridiales bacterium]|nr:PaaI family thioesterase [Clostridiales bacterium]
MKVVRKQENARDCFVCGRENETGLKADFFEMEDGTVVGIAVAQPTHQSYPNIVHGGVGTALLDETIGRAIKVLEPDTWGVTVELNVKFKIPVPYGERLIATGRITDNGGKVFCGEGEIILPNGDIAVTATGVFFKMSANRLISMGAEEDMMQMYISDSDPVEIEILEEKSVNRNHRSN